MGELAGSSDEDEKVSAELPKTDLEAAALCPAIADLLRSIPLKWTEFDFDQLTKLQSQALFLLTAAGMVERRGWIRTTIANHPTCFEIRFQATGEGGFNQALEHATAVEFQTWKDAWLNWCNSETKARSPFHSQEIKPQEWRLTDQGELARGDLDGANPDSTPAAVFDFVLKRGFFGPGYWNRRAIAGRPFTDDDLRVIKRQMAAGREPGNQSRPPVFGSGRLLDIRKIEQTAPVAQAVTLTNWPEGASAFANAVGKMLVPMFESMNKARQVPVREVAELQPPDPPAPGGREAEAPTPFRGGEMVFLPDLVTLCGADICRGPRCESRRQLLELLSHQIDGRYVGYSGEEIALSLRLAGGAVAVAGLVRDLRDEIVASLRDQEGIDCDRQAVVLSRDEGYRLSPSVSVRREIPNVQGTAPHRDDPDRDDPNDPDRDDPNDPDRDDPGDPDDSSGASARQAWILEQLADNRELRAPDVVWQLGCSLATAKRALQALKRAGRIVFVGDARTGSYRLNMPQGSSE